MKNLKGGLDEWKHDFVREFCIRNLDFLESEGLIELKEGMKMKNLKRALEKLRQCRVELGNSMFRDDPPEVRVLKAVEKAFIEYDISLKSERGATHRSACISCNAALYVEWGGGGQVVARCDTCGLHQAIRTPTEDEIEFLRKSPGKKDTFKIVAIVACTECGAYIDSGRLFEAKKHGSLTSQSEPQA